MKNRARLTNRYELVSRLFFLFLSLSLLACITQTGGTRGGKASAAGKPLPAVWDSVGERLFVMQENPRPGDPLTVIYYRPRAGNAKTETEAGRPRAVLFALSEGKGSARKKLSSAVCFDFPVDAPGTVNERTAYAAILAIPSTAPAGRLLIEIESHASDQSPSRILAELTIEARGRDFAAEEIPLNAGNTALRTSPDPRKTAEALRLQEILNNAGSTVYLKAAAFVPPVPANTRRTSFFGDRRVYLYSNGKRDTAIHAGIDYGVPTGTKVYAPAGGKVVFAGPRIVTGNSVVLEHAPGLYTLYYHLEKVLAAKGQLLKQGELIAESGSTGLATGPHLHWEIRAGGENTDPDALCAAPLLDAGSIAKRLLETAR